MSKTEVVWDKQVKGLHTRIYPTGKKVYFYYYRDLDRTQRRPKLGDAQEITLQQARELAVKIQKKVQKNRADRLLFGEFLEY